MRKWSFFLFVFLIVCMVGCAAGHKEDMSDSESTKLQADGKIDEKIDENLYVEAEFQMPKTDLAVYSSELKQFDYDKIQDIVWPDVAAAKVTTDESGMRYYDTASIGGERGSLIYRADDDVDYMDTLCTYAEEKSMTSKKDLKFATIEKVSDEAERLLSKLNIGCDPGEPEIVALDEKDLNKTQKEIMNDKEYKDTLNAKKLGNMRFESDAGIYRLKYSFTVQDIPVFGQDNPYVQYKGDYPLVGQNMGASIMISESGIEMISLEGVLDPLVKTSDRADIIDYEGLKDALNKKFGNVILTDEYKVTNIWMEYFPLIDSNSFDQVEVIPVWCCDFEVNGEDEGYTLRFNALTGKEIS